MKRTITSISQVCCALLFLICTKAVSQENPSLIITPELSKQINDKEFDHHKARIFPVSYKEITSNDKTIQKMTYVINDVNSVELTSFSGRFVELPKKYRWVYDDIGIRFTKDELTDNAEYDFNQNQASEQHSLIKNIDTDAYYFVTSDSYITKLKEIESTKELLKIVHKLGYKEYKSNDRYDETLYIKSKACEIKLNNWTYNGLKKNPSYIATLDNHQMKSDALTKQTIQHSKTLDKYLGLYRIQRNKMSVANINAWRIATTQAQKLNDQMVKLDEKYAGDYSFMPLNNLSTISENFSDNLDASKSVLGM